ncbi:MAG: ABC transporter related protein [candidate division TM6 bacterium GW2011_GWF2_38_10]|nr:MAG: ABC transporter related protein [candidate division TM6 bacterium GW2011_GWF2_38_10]
MGDTVVQALKGINLSVDAGEFIAITGFSGSGKSTLMHVIGCLDNQFEGSYSIDSVDVGQAQRDELAVIRNQKIGFVFQKFHLLADLTALDNVALPRLYAGVTEEQARQEAAKLLELVDLGHRMDHYPYQLSGGQQQRVAIARSLVNKPSILLADEPTGNLDSETGDTILKIFRDLNEQHKVTIVLVTHEPSIAAKAKRIIELVDGNIIADKQTGNEGRL